jgi:hypothetical protein
LREFKLAAPAQAIVDEFFLDSAEEDYLTARWAAQTMRLHQYCWSASQAIEKSSKALLLKLKIPLQENSGHNVTGLIKDNILCDLPHEIETSLPTEAIGALKFGRERLYPQSTISVLEHFESNGKPVSRYRGNPQTKVYFCEIHLLDATFTLLRTLAGRPVAPLSDNEPRLPTDQCKIKLFSNRFPQLKSSRAANALMIKILANQNIEYFPELFLHDKPLIGGFSVRNNSWANRKANAISSQEVKEQEDLEWVINNANLTRRNKEALVRMAEKF